MAMEDIVNSKFFYILNCLKCSQYFSRERKALQLPCSHNLCSECISHFTQNAQGVEETLKCPECHVGLTNQEAGECPVNLFVQSLIITVAEAAEATFVKECVLCKKTENLFICWNCMLIFCELCSQVMHKKQRSHEHIVKLDEVDEAQVMKFLSTKKEHCTVVDHSQKSFEYFCLRDSELMCENCNTLKHEGHDKLSIEEAADKHRGSLQDIANQLREKYKKVTKESQLATKKINQMKVEAEFDKFQIKQHTDEIIAIIQNKRDILFKHIDSNVSQAEKPQIAMKMKLDSHASQLMQCLEETKAALTIDNPTQILRKLVDERTQSLLLKESVVKNIVAIPYNSSSSVESMSKLKEHINKFIYVHGFTAAPVSTFRIDFDPSGISLLHNKCSAVSRFEKMAAIFGNEGRRIATLKLNDDVETCDILMDDEVVYIADENSKFHIYAIDGNYKKSLTFSTAIGVCGIAIHGKGLFVCCLRTQQIYKAKMSDLLGDIICLETFLPSKECGIKFECPFALASNSNLLIVSDRSAHKVHAFDFDGRLVFTYGTGQSGADDGQLYYPWESVVMTTIFS